MKYKMDVRYILLLVCISFTYARHVFEKREIGNELEKEIEKAIAEETLKDPMYYDFDSGDKKDNQTQEGKHVATDDIIDINIKSEAISNKIGGDMVFNTLQSHSRIGTQGDLTKEKAMYWNYVETDDNGNKIVKIPFVYLENANDPKRVSQPIKDAFEEAIEEYDSLTCIRFVPRTNEANFIKVINDSGCYSYVGQQNSAWFPNGQPLSLQYPGCHYKGIAIHEMMHAIGYFHEQSRPDRKKYVKVNLQNVYDGFESNFDIMDTTNQGTKYDFVSIMHYGEYAFSKNGKKTIQRVSGEGPLGQRDGLSKIDIESINLAYCPDYTTTTSTTASTTTVSTTTTPETTTTEEPVIPIITGIGWPEDEDFCPLVREGGLCKFCACNSHCTNDCADRNQYCPNWQQEGYCYGKYAKYMAKNCAGSCKDDYCLEGQKDSKH